MIKKKINFTRLKEIICKAYNDNRSSSDVLLPEKVEIGSFINDDLNLDSLDILELSMGIEKEAGLEPIPDEILEKIYTVGDWIDHLKKADCWEEI